MLEKTLYVSSATTVSNLLATEQPVNLFLNQIVFYGKISMKPYPPNAHNVVPATNQLPMVPVRLSLLRIASKL